MASPAVQTDPDCRQHLSLFSSGGCARERKAAGTHSAGRPAGRRLYVCRHFFIYLSSILMLCRHVAVNAHRLSSASWNKNKPVRERGEDPAPALLGNCKVGNGGKSSFRKNHRHPFSRDGTGCSCGPLFLHDAN